MEAASRRILIVANRTAATPLLMDAVRKRAAEGPSTFALVIPNEPRKGGADWTLDTAIPLLERAAGWLEPGGRLVYAVCSLEREEGEDQAEKVALASDPIRPDELPAWLSPTAEGWLRTDPGMLAERGGMDGFFIARFVNRA